MNIVKIALEEKKAQLEANVEFLLEKKSEIMIDRVKKMFADAFEFLPTATVSCRYGDSIQIEVDRKEILSLNSRSYDSKKGYLNTYSTMMETDFEMKRIIFNGLIARKFLCNINETFAELFAKTGIEEGLSQLQGEIHQLRSQLSKVAQMELEEQRETMNRFLRTGEEVELSKLVNFKFDRTKWDYIHRVCKIKLEDVTKKDAKVILTLKGWSNEDEDQIRIMSNVKLRYIQDFINETAHLKVAEEK